MRAVLSRSLLPLKSVLDDVYDTVDDASAIDTKNRKGLIRSSWLSEK